MYRHLLVRGLIIVLALAFVAGILIFSLGYLYRQTENRNFANLREKAELDCAIMPYHCALKEGDIQKITALKTTGSDINSPDRFGNTPLLYALSWNLPLVEPLLRLGADPNIPNEQGLTPLEQSLNLGDFSLAETLIRHGADPNAKAEGDTKKYLTLLTDFIIQKNERAASFLVEHGADLSKKDGYGYAPCERVVMYHSESTFAFCNTNNHLDLSKSKSIYTNDELGIQLTIPAGWKITPQPLDPEAKHASISIETIEKVPDDFGLIQFILDPRIHTQGMTIKEWVLQHATNNNPEFSVTLVTLDGIEVVELKDKLFEKTRYRYFVDMGDRGVMNITYYSSPRYNAQYSEILNNLVFTRKEG